ncbi:MAG: hypothetical protein AAFO57_08195 [Pseudomonadota bacterium]
MDDVELSARLTVHPISTRNFPTLQFREIAMHANPEHLHPCQRRLPTVQQRLGEDDFIQNEAHATFCDRRSRALVGRQRRKSEGAKVQTYVTFIISVEKEAIRMVVELGRQHVEGVINTDQQMRLGQ